MIRDTQLERAELPVIATHHCSLSKVKKSVKSNITDYSLERAVANAPFFVVGTRGSGLFSRANTHRSHA